MAWEEIHGNSRRGMTGDKPLDALALALRSIAQAYQQRFSRNPTVTEVLYAVERTLKVHGELLEGGGPERGTRIALVAGGDGATPGDEVTMTSLPIDVAQFEGAYTDRTKPGYYLVARRGRGSAEVVRVPRLEVGANRTVEAEYDVLDPAIDDEQAQRLIAGALLKVFLDDSMKGSADAVHYRNLATGAEQTLPYPR